jgi:hypothetical protein
MKMNRLIKLTITEWTHSRKAGADEAELQMDMPTDQKIFL